MRLDGPMLDQVVGLTVNPYYCHNAARDVPGEAATKPMLIQAMGRSSFDAGVQRAFRDHVTRLQQPLVEAGAGLYSVVTCTPAESRLTGSGLRGTFDRRVGLPLSRKRKIARIYERESRAEEGNRGNDCCPPFAHWYPLVDTAYHKVANTDKSQDDITLWDVAYTDANPPGLDSC